MSLISESKKDVVSADSLRAKIVRPVQLYGGPSIAYATYDFGINGCAISSISLTLNKTIPSGAIITQVITNSTAAHTSGGAPGGQVRVPRGVPSIESQRAYALRSCNETNLVCY